jgi:hypothetical protein
MKEIKQTLFADKELERRELWDLGIARCIHELESNFGKKHFTIMC